MSTIVPTYDQFIDPVFRVLERHSDGLSTAKAHDLVAYKVGLTQQQCDEILPSGRQGVFITTSAFTEPAREFAAQVSDGIVLVDGPMLTRLMTEFGVVVSTQRVVRIVQVDTDYFEDAQVSQFMSLPPEESSGALALKSRLNEMSRRSWSNRLR